MVHGGTYFDSGREAIEQHASGFLRENFKQRAVFGDFFRCAVNRRRESPIERAAAF